MAEGSSGERTEKATGKKREQARKKGQVARSMEVNGALVLLTGVTLLLLSAGHFGLHLGDLRFTRDDFYQIGFDHEPSFRIPRASEKAEL